ncbi:MAG: hypothetical protein K9W44_17285 [Candidatus Lokiarchaeota archaeon]|nr:hypothetical protein [Candidatus Harpocratesius repetitus]
MIVQIYEKNGKISIFNNVKSINFGNEEKQAVIWLENGEMRVLANFESILCK